MEFVSCDPSNYRAGRTQPVRYIVMHYTANNGDTARNNCDYYHRVGRLQASAHYFVDEHGAMQSVREGDTAWHCGARAYWHPECRNANSIGIEMCSRKRADGSYYILPETVANAAALAREIMQRYGIDTDHVLRHYDVTGKHCPMPWVDDPAQWTAFKDTLTLGRTNEEEEEPMTRYNKIDDIPAWARSDAQRLIDRGALRGNERGELDLSLDMLRTLIVCQRLVDQAKETKMDRLTTIKAAACTAAAALTAFWGWTGWLAAAWFLAMLLDYATGSAAALRAGTWSSRAAREGLWHKAGSVAGVLVAALLDFALRVLLGSVPGLGIDYDVLLCPLVTAWYLLTELGSIAENAGALGAPMPQFLMRAIAALRAGISDRGGGDGDGGGAA